MQQGMLLCHSWGEEESFRARHTNSAFHKIVSRYQKNTTTKAHFTLGVKANNVRLKSSIRIGAKVEISLMGFLH
jgi:hypothetical protein